jgi:phosphoserine phosphatase RsbU/P
VNSDKNALADGFVVVRGREFAGVGFGLDLMRMVADLQQAKNRQIVQSIDYASVIQRAMLRTSQDVLRSALPHAAMIWEPRDIIGGDFFLCEKFDNGVFIAIADCTGHGVPGAFMTLISSSWLGQTLEKDGPSDPAQLLGTLNRKIKQSLGQMEHRERGGNSDDGLDAILLWINQRDNTVTYAGARVPLYHLKKDADSVTLHESDRMGVGYVGTPLDHRWQNRTVAVGPDERLMVVTDGLTDQIGGPRNIAFGKRRLRDLCLEHRAKPVADAASSIMKAHRAYQGQQRRRDDLTLFCMRTSWE